MRKYGTDTFTIEKLDVCDSQEKANELEDYYILQYDSIASGLNLKRGGAHGEYSPQSRKKMSESKTGEKNNRFGIVGEAHPMFGKTHTKEAKKKITDSQTGEKHWMFGKEPTEELKARLLKQSHKVAKLDEQKVREIKQLLRDGVSMKVIAILYDVCYDNIRAIRDGRTWSSVSID